LVGENGFGQTVVGPVGRDGGDGAAVSSSAIRAALARGDARAAEAMLGRPYWLTGRVIRGVGRGREIGVPTANLETPPDKLLPASGIYAARAWDGPPPAGPEPLDAVLHIGPRPVFDDARTTVEAHVLDRQLDLYGRTIRLEVVERLREVSNFASVADLVAAIHRDVADARRVLATAREGIGP
jgi:riboflavin kinase/FMN adenylyltransferase